MALWGEGAAEVGKTAQHGIGEPQWANASFFLLLMNNEGIVYVPLYNGSGCYMFCITQEPMGREKCLLRKKEKSTFFFSPLSLNLQTDRKLITTLLYWACM